MCPYCHYTEYLESKDTIWMTNLSCLSWPKLQLNKNGNILGSKTQITWNYLKHWLLSSISYYIEDFCTHILSRIAINKMISVFPGERLQTSSLVCLDLVSLFCDSILWLEQDSVSQYLVGARPGSSQSFIIVAKHFIYLCFLLLTVYFLKSITACSMCPFELLN